MAFLELVTGAAPGTRFELRAERAVIGRSAECDVPLDVAAVSRRHAVIVRESGGFFVEDLHSRNGTYLNQNRVVERAALTDGDDLMICDQTFRFHGDVKPSLTNRGATMGDTAMAEFLDEEDTKSAARASVMATFDVSGGSASWGISAKPEVKLAALMEISNNLSRVLDVDLILPKLLESLFKIFLQADRGFIAMKTGDEGKLAMSATKTRRASDDERIRISRTIAEEAMRSRKAILSADAASDERFNMAQSIADFSIRSMICAPMIGTDGEPLGIIQIDTLNQRARFNDEDLEVLASVASQAAATIDNAKMHEQVVAQQAMQRDLELARRMQRALLPSKPPQVPGYFFYDYYQAARQVGGDYYDYVQLPGGRYAVIVGDVAGKGVSAALLMARLSSDVRFSLASEPDPAKAVQQINEGFAHNDWQDRFVTMIAAIVNPKTNELTIVNAGHMAPLLRRKCGQIEDIGEDIAGLPLGVADGYEFESLTRTLEPGEVVTIFTDGISEAMNSNRDLYGLDRLRQELATPNVPAAELGEFILDDVRRFANGFAQSDDMCMVCFGRTD